MKERANEFRESLVRTKPRMRSARSRRSWSLATAAVFPLIHRTSKPGSVLASELPRQCLNSGERNNEQSHRVNRMDVTETSTAPAFVRVQ